jgi:hypothetical protein
MVKPEAPGRGIEGRYEASTFSLDFNRRSVR